MLCISWESGTWPSPLTCTARWRCLTTYSQKRCQQAEIPGITILTDAWARDVGVLANRKPAASPSEKTALLVWACICFFGSKAHLSQRSIFVQLCVFRGKTNSSALGLSLVVLPMLSCSAGVTEEETLSEFPTLSGKLETPRVIRSPELPASRSSSCTIRRTLSAPAIPGCSDARLSAIRKHEPHLSHVTRTVTE